MSSLTFGVSLPSAGPMASSDNMRAMAQAAERLGYESIWVSDHVIEPVQPESQYPYGGGGPFSRPGSGIYYEPLTTLAWLAAITERVRLGISVLVVPLRNPVYAAKTLATLDALSDGRVTLGIGVGWLEEEFEVLNEPRFKQRGSVTDEWISIYRALWAQDEIATFEGQHYRFGPIRSLPKPVQRPLASDARWPGPPIWVGGNSLPALRRAVRLGDGWQGLRTSVDETRTCLGQLDQLLAEADRSRDGFAISARLSVSAEASDATESDWDVMGDAAKGAERVARYRDLGAQDFLITPQPRDSVPGMIESLEWFASEVRPLLMTRG